MFRQPGIYNVTRTIKSILKRYRKEPPSLTMHLYSAGFRLGHKDSNLHAYDGEMKHWMDSIREQKMPNELLDVLDELAIRFYDGCLIIEVHDHRAAQQSDQTQSATERSSRNPLAQPNQASSSSSTAPQRASNNHHIQNNPTQSSTSIDLPNDQVSVHRLVLTPTCETLWKDILLMNEAKVAQPNGVSRASSEFKWGPITEEEAVELEAAILDRTAPALCLSPSIITSRIANQMLRETILQPCGDKNKSRKRPLNSGEKEAMRRQRERQERYMHIADEGYDQPFAPTFSRIDLVKRLRTSRPVLAAPKECQKTWNGLESNQEQPKGIAPQMTVAPSDLHLAGYTIHGPKNESNQAHNPMAGSTSHQQMPPSSRRPPTPLPALPPFATTAPAPTKKTASKKKAVERSETVSPAGSSLAPTKKPPKKPKKQVEMTPEAAEEKRKKQAEQRRLQKERKLALAAAAKVEAAQSTTTAVNTVSTPTNRESSVVAALPPTQNSITIPNRDHLVIQPTEYPQERDINISIPDSISVVTSHSISVPSQFGLSNNLNSIAVPNILRLSNNPSPAPHGMIPVHQELNPTRSGIPVPAFNHSIPVPSSHSSMPVHQGIPVPPEPLPMGAIDSIPVPSASADGNSIPVPNLHHHQLTAQLSSVPSHQAEPHLWHSFAALPRSAANHQHRPSDMDIDVQQLGAQPSVLPSLTSNDVPNLPLHLPSLHQPHLTQEQQQQQQHQYHHKQQQQQQAHQQQQFRGWSN